MAPTIRHLRSSTTNKRPAASGIADGQFGINTASGTPGLFFKDNAGTIVKVGPVHVGASAPNVSPAGSAGNSTGELWVDNSSTIHGLNYYSGSAFVNLTPSGTSSAAGLVRLATSAEVQAGTDQSRVVTPSGLQSKVSDSTSTTSSTTIASATAVKAAYDLANAALPKSGGSVTGELLIAPSGSLVFEGSSDDSFETTIAVANPTADRTITFPNTTGSVVTTGDSGTVTSTMIADGTIVNADVNASAAIAGTKVSPDFGSQNVVTTGTGTAASFIPTSSTVPTNGIYLPAANNVALATNGAGRLFVDSSGNVGIGIVNPNQLLQVNGNVLIGATPAAQYSNFTVVGDSAIQAASPLFNFVNAAGSTRFGYINHTGTAGDIYILNQEAGALRLGSNNQERLRVDSSGRLLVGTTSDTGGALLQVNGNRVRIATAKTPASASDTGTTGEVCWDSSYIYVCTATNTWKRAALSTW